MLKQLTRIGAAASVAAIALGAAAPAMAAVPQAFRDAENNVYVTGLSPQSRVALTYRGMMRGRDVQANPCGAIVLRNSSTNPISGTITVGGTSVNTATLPTQLMPNCTGGSFEEARSANFKTSTGDVVIVGQTPGSYINIQTPQDRERSATANACGFVRFANSTAFQHTPSTAVWFDGIINSPINQLSSYAPPLCNRGTMYVPASWLSGS